MPNRQAAYAGDRRRRSGGWHAASDHRSGTGGVPARAARRAGRRAGPVHLRRVRDLRARQRGRHGRGPGGGSGRPGRGCPPVSPGPQRAGHGPHGRGLCQAAPADAHLRVYQLHRARCHEHGHGGGGGDRQPDPGAPAARGHVRLPARLARAPAAGAAGEPGRQRQRCVSPGVALLGPHRPAGAAGQRPACRLSGAHQPRGDRCGHRLPAPGCPGRGVGVPRGAVPAARLGHPQGEAGHGAARPVRGCHRGRASADDRGRRWRPVLRGRGRARRLRSPVRDPGHGDAGGQGLPRPGTIRSSSVRSA